MSMIRPQPWKDPAPFIRYQSATSYVHQSLIAFEYKLLPYSPKVTYIEDKSPKCLYHARRAFHSTQKLHTVKHQSKVQDCRKQQDLGMFHELQQVKDKRLYRPNQVFAFSWTVVCNSTAVSNEKSPNPCLARNEIATGPVYVPPAGGSSSGSRVAVAANLVAILLVRALDNCIITLF